MEKPVECAALDGDAYSYLDEIVNAFRESVTESVYRQASLDGNAVANRADVYHGAMVVAESRPTYIKRKYRQ